MAANDQHQDQHDDHRAADDADAGKAPPDKPKAPPEKAKADDDGRDAREREIERLNAQIREINRKAAADRHRLQEIDEAERRQKEKELPEVERLRRERDELAEANRRLDAEKADALRVADEARLESLVEREARKLDFDYPDTAFRLIDRSRLHRDDETGRWEGVQAAVERLAKDYPNLLRARRPGGGTPPTGDYPGNPPRRTAARAEPADPFDQALAHTITPNLN